MFDHWRNTMLAVFNALDQHGRYGRHIALGLAGTLTVISVTAIVSALDFNLPIAICALLLIIVLLSLFSSIASAAIFSVVAVVCLNYFFVAPLYSYAVDAPQDFMALAAFLTSSLVTSTLIRRNRTLGQVQSAQAHQIDLANYLAEAQKLSHTGSFGWDVSSDHLIWSDETFRIFGVETTITPSREIVLQRVHPDDVQNVRDTFERAAQTSENVDIEHRLLFPDGTIKHLHVVAHATSNDAVAVRFVGAVMDVTAQKETYAELKRGEQRYRHLFNLVPIALFQLDASTLKEIFTELRKSGVTDLQKHFDENPEFLYTCMSALIYQEANERAVRLFGGKDANDFIGRSIGRGWKERPDTFQRAMVSRFNGETTFEEETKMTTLDGRVIDVLFTTARLGLTGNVTTSVIGAIDITERVRAREQLHQLQADLAHASRVTMLGELTASIAHEVNQPLGAIAATGAASLRWLDQPNPNLGGIRLRIEHMMEDARRAADIITRVRAMATNVVPERQHVEMDDIIRDALLFLRQEIASRSTIVTHRAESSAPPIFGDRTQLQQLIVNLCINAIQAMQHPSSAQRKIAISTTVPSPDIVCCLIEDSGPGVKVDYLGRIFDSFFTTKDGGMGMGLAICRSIVTSHGGNITVDNNSSLGGARFMVTLPAAEAQALSA